MEANQNGNDLVEILSQLWCIFVNIPDDTTMSVPRDYEVGRHRTAKLARQKIISRIQDYASEVVFLTPAGRGCAGGTRTKAM